jgi:hypothetical protein
VTLAASVGSVTDNGAGKWTWTYPTGTDSSKVVYITATDSGGRTGQIPFFLQIDNTAPALVLPGPQAFVAGTSPSFGISVTDPDAVDTIALGASGLPAGLNLTDNGNRTGTVSGALTAPPGVYPVTFSANDGHHAAVTGTVMITVTQATKPLTAVVDHPERLVKGAITVGCLLDKPSLRSCRADVLIGSKRVGRATKTISGNGKSVTNVRVTLSTSARKKIARSVGGQPVKVRLLAKRVGPAKTLTASADTRVVPLSIVTSGPTGIFAAGAAGLTSKGQSYLTKLAKAVGKAKQVVCTGYPDTAAQGKSLGKARATAACAFLGTAGLKAKFKSAGKSVARAKNLTIAILR